MNLFDEINDVMDSPNEEKELQSSVGQIEGFLKSLVWFDIQEITKERISQAQVMLETAPNMEEVKEIRGEIKTFKFLLNLPDVLLQLKKEEENNKEMKGVSND